MKDVKSIKNIYQFPPNLHVDIEGSQGNLISRFGWAFQKEPQSGSMSCNDSEHVYIQWSQIQELGSETKYRM